MKVTTIYDCSIIAIDKHQHEKGNISVIENGKSLSFDVTRIFYLYDIPGGEDRGAHAHKECHQFIVALSGAFDIVLDDGSTKRTVSLNRPYFGLHVPPGIWAGEIGFSSGSVCLVLASHLYDADDYIRDYGQFLNYKRGNDTIS